MMLDENKILFIKDKAPQMALISVVASLTLYTLYNTSMAFYTRKQAEKRPPKGLKEVPAPRGALPYFGHIFQIPNNLPALKFDEWHKEYGPIIRLQMGVKPWIIIGDRHIANDILKVRGAVTSGRPYHLFLSHYHTLNQRGPVFTNPDKRWKKSRTAAQTILGPKGVSQITDTIEREAARVTQLLLEGTMKNKSVDITKYMQLFPLNTIMQTCFGVCAESLNDPLFQSVVYTIQTTVKWGAPRQDMGSFLPAFSKLFGLLMSNNEKHMQEFAFQNRNPLFRRLIQEALDNDTPCFVKVMYNELKEENGFEDDDILVFMSDMMNAGTDPTAMTLSWAFVILSRYQDVQKRLRDEVDMFIAKHKRLPVYEERENFPLLISVQKECIRYRSAKHLALAHEATQDFEYQGYLIKKGTTILPNTYTLSRSSDFYDDPEEFMPERYINDLTPFSVSVNASVDIRDLYTFGWGRRMCPGVHLVDVEFFNLWVRILATTVIEPALANEGEPQYVVDLDVGQDVGILVAPSNPYLRFIERSDRLI